MQIPDNPLPHGLRTPNLPNFNGAAVMLAGMAQVAGSSNGAAGGNNEQGIDGGELKRLKQAPRKRVSQACDRCRSRKDKCDGKKPVRNFSYVGECVSVPLSISGVRARQEAGRRKDVLTKRTKGIERAISTRGAQVLTEVLRCIGLLDMYIERP